MQRLPRYPHHDIYRIYFKAMKFPLSLLLLTLISFGTLHSEPLKVSVKGKSVILYNPRNGAILFEKRSKEPHYPASITKMATALFLLDAKNVALTDQFLVTGNALRMMNASIKQKNPLNYPPYVLEHDGVVMGLNEGEHLTLNTLLHGLLLGSYNDAANVIAENCSGSVELFMEELNAYLREKGIYHSRFQNPHGLHHPAQMTTAYDMARIAALLLEKEEFLEISIKPSFDWPGRDRIVNGNKLLKEGAFYYPKVIGGKTGYTEKAGFNLVVAAEEKGRRLIAVVLGCENREDRYKDAIALFETAFREKQKERVLFSSGDNSFFHEVPKATATLRARIDEDLKIHYFPSEEGKLHASVMWSTLSLPIQEGEAVGRLLAYDERGNVVASASLLAVNPIKKTGLYLILDFLRSWKSLVFLFIPSGLLFFFFKSSKKRRKFL